MSMKLMVTAMNCKVGNPIRKLVLLKLADNANDDGECWPSYKYIAEQCEVSRSSVKEHIRQLEESGFLYREFRKDGKLNKSNIFHLTLGQDMPGVGQEITHPQTPDNLGGGSPADPRTSHSSEPVREPVKEPASATPEKPESEISAKRVADYLYKRLLEELPEAKTLNPEKWVKEIERAIRIDKRSEQEMLELIDWMHTGNKFWVPNVQSGQKLREKYLTIVGQMRRPNHLSKPRQSTADHNRDAAEEAMRAIQQRRQANA